MLKRLLAIAGVVVILLPLVLMLLTGAYASLRSGRPHVDWLLPGELAYIVLLGGALLAAVSLWARRRRLFFCLGFGVMVLLLGVSMGIAVLTGLADGSVSPGGWQMWLVGAVFGLYVLAELVLGIAGISLARQV